MPFEKTLKATYSEVFFNEAAGPVIRYPPVFFYKLYDFPLTRHALRGIIST